MKRFNVDPPRKNIGWTTQYSYTCWSEEKERFFFSSTGMVTICVIEKDASRITVLLVGYRSRCPNQEWWHPYDRWFHAVRLQFVSGLQKAWWRFAAFKVSSSDVSSPTTLVTYVHCFSSKMIKRLSAFFCGYTGTSPDRSFPPWIDQRCSSISVLIMLHCYLQLIRKCIWSILRIVSFKELRSISIWQKLLPFASLTTNKQGRATSQLSKHSVNWSSQPLSAEESALWATLL